MRRRTLLALAGLVGGLWPAAVVAQQSSAAPVTSAATDAYAVVTRLFDAMRARDTTTMRALFVPNATMQTLRDTSVTMDRIDGWLAGVARAPQGLRLDERVANPVIHVDANLASIWVDYWFFAGDRFSHCGVDALWLTRQAGAWRIFSIVDTRRTAGCAPPPAG